MFKKLMIASAVSAALATGFAYAQQEESKGTSSSNTSTMNRNQDAPSGGVGQVFPDNQAQSTSSEGASGASGASGNSSAAGSGDLMQRNQDAPSGGVGQVFPNDSKSGDSAGSSGASGPAGSEGSSSGQAQGKKQDGSKTQGAANAPVYLLVPVDVAANDNSMKNGCWARIYARENYLGDSLTIVGPSTLPDMDQAGLFGLNWDDRVNSIELGPKASMTVYDNENFRDIVGQFKPGQRVPDIDTRTGFFEEFASIKLECSKA